MLRYLIAVIVFVCCYTLNLIGKVILVAMNRITLNKFRFFYDLVMILMFQVCTNVTSPTHPQARTLPYPIKTHLSMFVQYVVVDKLSLFLVKQVVI